jgi:hypothetical protein
MWQISHKHPECFQYYAEFQVIAADLDWNTSAPQKGLRMPLSQEMQDSFTYSDMPEALPAFGKVCQTWDNHIHQWRAAKAT